MAFPTHRPSGRSFDAGDYRYKTFSSQSGKEYRILYGDKRTGMKLQLQYANIADTKNNPVILVEPSVNKHYHVHPHCCISSKIDNIEHE